MKHPCRSALILQKTIEWVSVGGAFVLSCSVFDFIDNPILPIVVLLLIFRNIFYAFLLKGMKIDQSILKGVSESEEAWCQKKLKISARQYGLYLQSTQKRRGISLILGMILSFGIWFSLCLYVGAFAPKALINFFLLGFPVGYCLGYLYGAWKYRGVDQPDWGQGDTSQGFASYYSATGDAAVATAMSRR